jgi:5-methyltetrahydrofolate--homocysteine methyltransferase
MDRESINTDQMAGWPELRSRYEEWWSPSMKGPIVQIYTLKKDLPPPVVPAWAHPNDRFWGTFFAMIRWMDAREKGFDVPEAELARYFEADFSSRLFLGDAFPMAWLNVGPGSLAAYLSGFLKFASTTTWFELPKPMDWDGIFSLELRDGEKWWALTRQTARVLARASRGKYILGTTDIGGVMDVLASLRTTNQLLEDCIDEPEKVVRANWMLVEFWHTVYEELHRIISAEGQEGSAGWMGIWAPGKWFPIQCDISAMLSPAMVEEMVIPHLADHCRRLDQTIYHWDGPGQIPHLDLLLGIKGLGGIQWVPGAGAPPHEDPRWMQYYRKIQSAGKRLVLNSVNPSAVKPLLNSLDKTGLLISTIVEEEDDARSLAHEIGYQCR